MKAQRGMEDIEGNGRYREEWKIWRGMEDIALLILNLIAR